MSRSLRSRGRPHLWGTLGIRLTSSGLNGTAILVRRTAGFGSPGRAGPSQAWPAPDLEVRPSLPQLAFWRRARLRLSGPRVRHLWQAVERASSKPATASPQLLPQGIRLKTS